jgi:hypothetical protein
MRRPGLAAAALLALALAGSAEARGQAHAPRIVGHHRAGMGEIKPIKSLGPSEFRPYEPAKPLKPFSYVDHERRGRKPR